MDWLPSVAGIGLFLLNLAAVIYSYGVLNQKVKALEVWQLQHVLVASSLATMTAKIEEVLRRLDRIENGVQR